MIRTLGIYLLTAVGLLGTLAIVIGSPPLERFAHASLLSPVLIVYSERGEQARYRIMSARFQLELSDAAGETHSIILDRDSYQSLVAKFNPLSRHIITLPYISSLVLHPDGSKKDAMRESVLRYGFCNAGPMSKALGISNDVTSISLRMIENQQSLPPPPALTLRCDS